MSIKNWALRPKVRGLIIILQAQSLYSPVIIYITSFICSEWLHDRDLNPDFSGSYASNLKGKLKCGDNQAH